MLTVMKFGGSGLSTVERLENAASIVAEKANAHSPDGDKVVVVVSARGKTTDGLVKDAQSVTDSPSPREKDTLMATGEQSSMALFAMTLQKIGVKAVSLCGWQAGIYTDDHHGNANITEVDTTRIHEELSYGNVVIVAGFQGICYETGDITTLGRGGSDTTAIALAVALDADACLIYTDVNGVYSADPRVAADAVKHDTISYNEMLEMSNLGARVLHNRSVAMAKHSGLTFEVRSVFEGKSGTLVRELAANRVITGIVSDDGIAMITVTGIDDGDSTCALFRLLADNDITVDVILRSQSIFNSRGTVSFSVSGDVCNDVLALISESGIRYEYLSAEHDFAKVSAVGSGLTDSCSVAAQILDVLNKNGIKPKYITTGEIRISVLVPSDTAHAAEAALNTFFFGEKL